MIPLYGLGIVVLLAALLLLSGRASNIRNALSARQWLMGGGTVVALGALLLINPRLALSAVGGLVLARLLVSILRRVATQVGPSPGAAGPAANGSSSVRTEWLHATLDHDSGSMDADIIQGRFAGKRLGELTAARLIELLTEMAQSEALDSIQIVEAFLDENHPNWRELESEDAMYGNVGDEVLTRAKALEILGLDDDADEHAIVAAHRRLIRAVHPDRGGSSYLASQLNRARDYLLGS